MTTFAHIETGRALDVQTADTLEFYKRIAAAKDDWKIVEVPPGTLSGSTDDGQGGWKPPATQVVVPQPVAMSGKEFTTYCAAVIEAAGALKPGQGLLRFDRILAVLEKSDAPLMPLARFTFQAALVPGGRFTLGDAAMFFDALVNNGDPDTMTKDEAGALVKFWTKQ